MNIVLTFYVHSYYVYVTVRVKITLVHTSNFAKLMVHKILLECYTKLKVSAMIK